MSDSKVMQEQCSNCKFYDLENQKTLGILNDDELHPEDYESKCRRYPPVRGMRAILAL